MKVLYGAEYDCEEYTEMIGNIGSDRVYYTEVNELKVLCQHCLVEISPTESCLSVCYRKGSFSQEQTPSFLHFPILVLCY